MCKIFIYSMWLIGIWIGAVGAREPQSAPKPAALPELLEKARVQELWRDRQWILLLHYERRAGGRIKSEASPEFFNAPDGDSNPQAELEATLARFFDPPVPEPASSEVPDLRKHPGQEHPQCRFQARYQWLKARLHFDGAKFPEQPCLRFHRWYKALEPQSLSLIFASHYMNNPASMFGHTFLRLNKAKNQGQELLDYGVNYAANVTTGNGLVYAIFGIFGGFDGVFTNFPYYMKVQEYNNIETRDLWEYELDLSSEARQRMLAHLWELGHTTFAYYFFKRNCSYLILKLLDVADPNLSLSDKFRFWVIPADTVRVVHQTPGLVTKIRYRPSLAKQIAAHRSKMSRDEDARFLSLVQEHKMPHKPQASLLDTALKYMWAQKIRGGNKLNPEDETFYQSLLEKRSEAGEGPEEEPASEKILANHPASGHDTMRLTWLGGYGQRLHSYSELTWAAVFHDLMAEPQGYPALTQIELMPVQFRYYADRRQFLLQRLNFVDVMSLIPYDKLFPKVSWKMNFGLERRQDIVCVDCQRLQGTVGVGGALTAGHDSVTAYGFAELEAAYAASYHHSYRVAPGATGGVLWDVLPRVRLYGALSGWVGMVGDEGSNYKAQLSGRVTLLRNLDLRLQGVWLRRDRECSAGLSFFM